MNSIGALISLVRNGGNPVPMIQQMAEQDPLAAQAMKIIGGKSADQLQKIATNMAREMGTTVEEVARNIGLM